jgi:hypothetical protein
VEASRKHGPFDTRWPRVRKDSSGAVPTASLSVAEVAEALEWDAFSAQHFGERRRHDSEARSAYAAYRQGREWRKSASPPKLRLVERDPKSLTIETEPDEAGAQRLLAAVAQVESWEGEGGFVPR